MKKLLFTILLSMFISCLFAQEYTTNMETIFTDQESTSSRLAHVKSAIDSKGGLHVVFTGFNNHFYYGTNQGGKWSFEQLQYFDTESEENLDVVKLTNMAVDKNDHIHIVTFDRYGEKLVYGKKAVDGGEFKLQTIQFSPKPLRLWVYGGMGEEYSDLAVDQEGGLHLICKSDFTEQNETRYQQCATYFYKAANADTWQPEVLVYDKEFDERNWGYGISSSIACYMEKVYVVMGGTNELYFGSRDISGGTWELERLLHTSDDFINSGKDATSLAISPEGAIRFAFYDRTDDAESPWHGLTIFSRSNCGLNEWRGYNSFQEPLSKSNPAVAFDKNGKFYLAMGRNGFALWHQACDCDAEYKKIYAMENIRGQVDMLIGKENTVYTFFTSDSDNQLRLLTAKPKGSTHNCNYPPAIVGYTGKTNLKPNEKWMATITASDPECDQIRFESIIHNEIFSIEDHGDGTATITATMPEGEGKGTPGLSVWALDEKHPNTNNEVSVISFNLVITPEGQEKGSIHVENKCTGGNMGMAVDGSNAAATSATVKPSESPAENNISDPAENDPPAEVSNPDCDAFLDDYQAFSEKYIPVAKKVKANPMDVQAAMQLGNMMEEFASYSLRWVNEYDCKDNPDYQARFDTITEAMNEASQ